MTRAWLVMLVACAQNHGPSAVPIDDITPVDPEPQRGGDPARGYAALVNEGYVSLGVPWSGFSAAMSELQPEDVIPGRIGDNANVGYSFNVATNRYGMKIASPNCLSCHAKRLGGKIFVGLGTPYHMVNLPSGIADNAISIDAGLTSSDEVKEFSQFGEHLVGSQQAGALMSFGALAAHRDPETLEWTEWPQFDPSTNLEGWVDVPPWWRTAKKNALYYDGSGRGDHVRHMMNMSVLSVVDIDEAMKIDAMFVDIAAYLRSIEPPKFPFPIDDALAAEGQVVFEETCATCHGTYGANGSYPNLIVPATEVGTDPSLATDFWANRDAVDWFNSSFYGKTSRYQPVQGYYAPPLDGIWATAPFFHNGSVPTLAAVIDSSLRPATWPMAFEDADYDPDTVGWRPDGNGDTYDTSAPGQSNSGHLYGDGLTTEERRAVLEYVKTL